MSIQLFAHTFLAQSSGVRSAIAGTVQQFFLEYFGAKALDVTLAYVTENGPPPVNEAIPAYRTAYGAPVYTADVPWGNDEPSTIATTTLLDGLRVVVLEDPNFDPAANNTTAVMDELANRGDETADIVEMIKTKNVERKGMIVEYDGRLRNIPEVALCGWAEAFDLTAFRQRINSATKSFIRRCLPGAQDGKRVSREVHEWNYCKTSEQLALAVSLCAAAADAGVAGVSATGDELTGNEPLSFGNFVDWEKGRKLIASIRKVRRLLRGANVKGILELTGQDRAALEQQLLDEINVDAATVQLSQIRGFD